MKSRIKPQLINFKYYLNFNTIKLRSTYHQVIISYFNTYVLIKQNSGFELFFVLLLYNDSSYQVGRIK